VSGAVLLLLDADGFGSLLKAAAPCICSDNMMAAWLRGSVVKTGLLQAVGV